MVGIDFIPFNAYRIAYPQGTIKGGFEGGEQGMKKDEGGGVEKAAAFLIA